MIVGSDGRNSPTAARAGIRRQGWAMARRRSSAPSRTKAAQWRRAPVLHAAGAARDPAAAGQPLVDRLVRDRRDAARIEAMDDAGYLEVLRPRFGDFLGEIRLAGKRWSYPLALSMTHRFVGPRLALIGDAAHAVHPIAGQGLNAGLKDVAALAEVLADARRRGEDIGRPEVLAATSAGGGSTRRRC
jgi:2-octaprenyl-6-methoxyphenol hydroxylase